MKNKLTKALCKIFGHNIDDIELLMFGIECKAINAKALNPKIACKRCKKMWKPKFND